MMRYFVFFLFQIMLLAGSEPGSDYNTPLTQKDKENLSYLINTLSSHSGPGLLFYKNELERRGMQTDHIHALQRLGYIFSDPKLAKETKDIGRGPWRRFARGFGKSLAKEYKEGNLSPEVVKDFANRIGADPSVIDRFVQNQDWEGLMNYLRDR